MHEDQRRLQSQVPLVGGESARRPGARSAAAAALQEPEIRFALGNERVETVGHPPVGARRARQ